MKSIVSTFLLSFFVLSLHAQWTPIAPLPAALRSTDHSFGFAIDGTGYLVSGTQYMQSVLKTMYKYNPENDKWTAMEDFPGKARGYAIGDVYEGKAYFGFGSSGFNTMLNDLWVFDPSDASWTELASCPCKGRQHPSFVAVNGKIFVGLGNDADKDLKDWWEYDIDSNSWTQRPDLPGSARHHPYQFGLGGHVYVGFGHSGIVIFKDWFRYDPSSNTWTKLGIFQGEGRVAGTQFSHNGFGYALSGDGSDHSSMETGEFWQYNPDTDTWLQLPPHPGSSRWAPASFVINDEVYLINGFEKFSFTYENEAFKYKLSDLADTKTLEQFNIRISPNPVANRLYIHTNGTNWSNDKMKSSIFNTQGQVVYSSNSIDSSIDISSLSAGNYWLMIQDKTNSGKWIKSFVKN